MKALNKRGSRTKLETDTHLPHFSLGKLESGKIKIYMTRARATKLSTIIQHCQEKGQK